MKGNELNQNLEVSPRDTFNVLFCGWKRTLPWRGQKGASDGGGGVGGGLSEHQALLLDSPELTLKVSRTPSPASPLPTNRETYVTHHCIEVIEQYILAGLTYQTVDLYPALKQNGCRMAAVPCTMASERWGCHCQPSGSNRGKTASPGTH